ncbi:protein translocase SEC61 complex subunit gamma [Candidatus Woesearchaeota archaeon]|nr:protein translocase SEC61 complex subunit gamma [Candidatus Woesearchaeota archaeon]
MIPKLKTFILKSKRVLKITKKPDNEEFANVVKVSGLGIIIIGLIGFLIQTIRTLLFRM